MYIIRPTLWTFLVSTLINRTIFYLHGLKHQHYYFIWSYYAITNSCTENGYLFPAGAGSVLIVILYLFPGRAGFVLIAIFYLFPGGVGLVLIVDPLLVYQVSSGNWLQGTF